MDENPEAYQQARAAMVREQLAKRGVRNEQVLNAMAEVPRQSFMSVEYARLAYKDTPVPIGYQQTISQPYIVAYMLQALQLQHPAEAVILEVGTGLGYQAAVLSRFVKHVFTVERIPELAIQARENLLALGYMNISVAKGDGGYGWPKYAPFDGIVVAAAAPQVPPPLVSQLKPGACMVAPMGKSGAQKLLRVSATPQGLQTETLFGVSFVPLLGEHGWRDRQAFER